MALLCPFWPLSLLCARWTHLLWPGPSPDGALRLPARTLSAQHRAGLCLPPLRPVRLWDSRKHPWKTHFCPAPLPQPAQPLWGVPICLGTVSWEGAPPLPPRTQTRGLDIRPQALSLPAVLVQVPRGALWCPVAMACVSALRQPRPRGCLLSTGGSGTGPNRAQ